LRLLKNRITAILLSGLMVVAGIGIGRLKMPEEPVEAPGVVSQLQEKDFYVEDGAAVLSNRTIDQIYEYNRALEEGYGASLAVETVDTLNGALLDDYTDARFEEKNLSDRSMLLVLAVGEEDYYAAYGKR